MAFTSRVIDAHEDCIALMHAAIFILMLQKFFQDSVVLVRSWMLSEYRPNSLIFKRFCSGTVQCVAGSFRCLNDFIRAYIIKGSKVLRMFNGSRVSRTSALSWEKPQ